MKTVKLIEDHPLSNLMDWSYKIKKNSFCVNKMITFTTGMLAKKYIEKEKYTMKFDTYL